MDILKSFLLRALCALFCGIALSFIHSPTEYWFLIFPCFSLFYICIIQSKSKAQVFFTAFLFAMGYFVAGLNWIGNALLVEGNEYRWVWPLAVIGLPLLLSFFTALYVTLSFIVTQHKGALGFLSFCFFLWLSEWVRGHAFTGFPWNLYGYGWIGRLEIAQVAHLTGAYGLTFLTIVWGSVAGYAHLNRQFALPVLSALLFVLCFLWGGYQLKKPDSVALDTIFHVVQPNIAQEDKWDSDKQFENFERLIALSRMTSEQGKQTGQKRMIVWPETALSPAMMRDQWAMDTLKTILDDDTILLSGVLDVSFDGNGAPRYHNALMLFEKGQPPQRLYSKSHLVPFGEYIPFQRFIPLKPVAQFQGFERGQGTTTIERSPFPAFSPQICYEIIFPSRMVARNGTPPDFILTVTNDAWYGISPGPYQHFTQARFRAIETGLPVVRSANNGISGLIDGRGRVMEKIPLSSAGYLAKML